MKALLILFYWLSPLVPIAVTHAAYPTRYVSFVDALPMWLGAFTFTWLMAQLVLSARVPFIERRFGLDRLLRLHAVTPLLVILMALVHKFMMEALFQESLNTRLGSAGLILLITVSALAMLFLGGMAGRFIPPLAKLRKTLSMKKGFDYGFQRVLHMISPLGALILFIHVMLSSSVTYSVPVRLVYMLYFSLASGAWLWHKLIRPAQRKRRAYAVREVRKETADIWTLRLTPPDGSRFRHREGQFGFIKFLTGNVSREPHPFSFSDMQDEHGTVTMTIKALGDYTRTIRNAKPGDRVAVDGPYGRFTPSLHPHRKLVLLAGGIGITPMLSILGHLRHTEPGRPVLLIWGINHSNELIRKDFFIDLQENMPTFHFVPVAFREPAFEGEKGAIDRDRLERLTRLHGFDDKDTGYYLCGPAPMMNMAWQALKGMGIPSERIHDEMFSL